MGCTNQNQLVLSRLETIYDGLNMERISLENEIKKFSPSLTDEESKYRLSLSDRLVDVFQRMEHLANFIHLKNKEINPPHMEKRRRYVSIA